MHISYTEVHLATARQPVLKDLQMSMVLLSTGYSMERFGDQSSYAAAD